MNFWLYFLVAAKSKGISSFNKLGELNKKESPRLDIAVNFLRMIGIKVLRKNDDIKIFGNPELNLEKSYIIKNFRKDHRIVMMSCVAALVFGGSWKINDHDSIKTSFPEFFKILKNLGAKINWSKEKILTIAIDSPAAAGAGTQAKLIAKEYNLLYLDTGKIYRYIGWLKLNKKNNFKY